jgi:hypothetical protein
MTNSTRDELPVLLPDLVPRLSPQVAVEYFEKSALIFSMRFRTIAELNAKHSWVYKQVNGKDSLAQIAQVYAKAFAMSNEQAWIEIHEICTDLLKEDLVRSTYSSSKGDNMDTTRYIVNPDVNLREEDEDGALLYNPDTDRVQLLNLTGLYIWKLCTQGRTVEEIIASLQADFDEAPADAVATDVEEFVTHMIDSGFLGTLQPS